MFPPQSTPSKRPKRRVESYRIYKRPYSACSQSSRPSPSSYEKATHGRLVGPTLSTPRGDKYYNQYRPLCEVCPRDRDKVVGTLQGPIFCMLSVFQAIPFELPRKPPTVNKWDSTLCTPGWGQVLQSISSPNVKCAPETTARW